jgi:hypothetical protein
MPSEEIQAIYQRYGIDGSGQKAASADSAAAAVPPQANAGTQSPSRAPKTDTAVVWKFHADGTMEPVKVSIGITDHAFTEVLGVLKGELKEGDAVVIRSVVAKNQAPGKLPR